MQFNVLDDVRENVPHLPLRLGPHSGCRVVPELTLDTLGRQVRRLPSDRQHPAAPAHCLHICGRARFYWSGGKEVKHNQHFDLRI